MVCVLVHACCRLLWCGWCLISLVVCCSGWWGVDWSDCLIGCLDCWCLVVVDLMLGAITPAWGGVLWVCFGLLVCCLYLIVLFKICGWRFSVGCYCFVVSWG